jgi:4-hydroxy-tetrahydrodipicolinate synthase
MQPLTAKSLKGNWATLLLPINVDGSINYQLLEEEVAYLIQARVSGIYSNGTAGEFYNQTETEFDRINELLAEQCTQANMPFQIGVCHPSPVICLERVERSKQLQPSAFQVILPDWVPTSPEEQLSFLQRVAEAAAPVPIVLYNPPHAKVVLKPLDYQRLSQNIPELIGIKVADYDAQWYAEMRQYAASLAVFVPGHHLATGVKEGVGAGAYSNIACLQPEGAQRWYVLMGEDLEEALRIEKKIAAFFAQCILPYAQAGYSNPALDKFLAAVGGWAPIGTRLRWPYRGIPESEVPPVRQVARQMLPELFLS